MRMKKMKYRKVKLIIMTIAIILAFIPVFIFGKSIPAHAACAVKSPYPQGFYASQLLDFKPGPWIMRMGPLYQGKDLVQKMRLHDGRLFNPGARVLGCPKSSLENSLTLGHGGYVIVGPADCFKNGKGPDILIHEPRSNINQNESFNVYVTADSNGKGPWFQIAKNVVVSNANNFLEIELGGIIDNRGYPVDEFKWIKIEDAYSLVVLSDRRYAGFDLSAVKFLHRCNVPIG